MIRNTFREKLEAARNNGRRMVAPLIGFPGLNMTKGTIKLAQQNFGEHYKVVKAVAETFEPDMIFPLMDLSVEANAIGRYTVFPKTDTATVIRDDFSLDELERIKNINMSFDTRLLGYVETIKLMSIGLPHSMVKGAYVTGPYSLAALMMGADDAAVATLLRPDELHELCKFTTEKIQVYIRLLIAAGAQVIGILEPTAVMLGPSQFSDFSSAYVRHIVNSCRYAGVATIYHTCGNTTHLAAEMVAAGIDAISLDSPAIGVDLPAIAATLPPDVSVMGNINPTGAMWSGNPEDVEAEVDDLLERMAPYPNYILSTGCDLPQDTPLENIHAFMRAGRRYRTGKG